MCNDDVHYVWSNVILDCNPVGVLMYVGQLFSFVSVDSTLHDVLHDNTVCVIYIQPSYSC